MIYLDLLSVQFPRWLKGHDSSFLIHTKHALFKEKKRGKKERRRRRKLTLKYLFVALYSLILSSLLLK